MEDVYENVHFENGSPFINNIQIIDFHMTYCVFQRGYNVFDTFLKTLKLITKHYNKEK